MTDWVRPKLPTKKKEEKKTGSMGRQMTALFSLPLSVLRLCLNWRPAQVPHTPNAKCIRKVNYFEYSYYQQLINFPATEWGKLLFSRCVFPLNWVPLEQQIWGNPSIRGCSLAPCCCQLYQQGCQWFLSFRSGGSQLFMIFVCFYSKGKPRSFCALPEGRSEVEINDQKSKSFGAS